MRPPANGLRRFTIVAALLALFATGTLAGSSDWTQIALATFTGVSDGPGNGSSYPAESGKITVVLPKGKTLAEIAPKTGVYSERLVLSDLTAAGTNEFGIHFAPTADALYGAMFSMCVRQDADNTAFGGEVSDGATTDMLAFEVSSGNVTVNGKTLKTKLKTGTTYKFEMNCYDVVGGTDFWEFRITNLDTGESEYVKDNLSGGYRAAHSMDLRKHAGRTGAFTVDSLSLLGLQH